MARRQAHVPWPQVLVVGRVSGVSAALSQHHNPSHLYPPSSCACAAVLDNEVYIIGGWFHLQSLLILLAHLQTLNYLP